MPTQNIVPLHWRPTVPIFRELEYMYCTVSPNSWNIYWRLKSRLFEKSCLFKGQWVQQGSYRMFLYADRNIIKLNRNSSMSLSAEMHCKKCLRTQARSALNFCRIKPCTRCVPTQTELDSYLHSTSYSKLAVEIENTFVYMMRRRSEDRFLLSFTC